MKARTNSCGQLFILTHSFAFFRQVKNWFHHLKGQRKPDISSRPARFFLLRTKDCTEDRERAAQIDHMDPLLEKYESEYHYLFRCVHREAYREECDKSLEGYYGLPNIARRLLESFLAFRHPDKTHQLHKVLDDVPFDPERKIRILRFVHTYSHADRLAEAQHDPYVLAGARLVLRDVLDLMQELDPSHYASMENLLTPTEEASP